MDCTLHLSVAPLELLAASCQAPAAQRMAEQFSDRAVRGEAATASESSTGSPMLGGSSRIWHTVDSFCFPLYVHVYRECTGSYQYLPGVHTHIVRALFATEPRSIMALMQAVNKLKGANHGSPRNEAHMIQSTFVADQYYLCR